MRDYSLRKRLHVEERKSTLKKKPKDELEAKLQCLEIDNGEPLSPFEWRNLSYVMREIKGMAWFQILPTGQKSSQPFQFNMLHMLPRSKFPVAKFPIETHVENRLTWRKKMEKSGFNVTDTDNIEKPTDRDIMEAEAFVSNLFMLPEYPFDHVCYSISETQMTESGLQFAYNNCRDFLRLKTRPELGFTVILTNSWIFVSVLTQPYATSAHGYPVYLDGLAFAGLVSLQNSVPSWPATAGLADNKHTVTKAI